jgi:AraC-like DNA-binding protein
MDYIISIYFCSSKPQRKRTSGSDKQSMAMLSVAPQSMRSDHARQEHRPWIQPATDDFRDRTTHGVHRSAAESSHHNGALILSGRFGEATLLTLSHSLTTQARSGIMVLMPLRGEGSLRTREAMLPLRPGSSYVLEPWQAFSVEIRRHTAMRLLSCHIESSRLSQPVSAHEVAERARDVLAEQACRAGVAEFDDPALTSIANSQARDRAIPTFSIADFRIRRVIRHLHTDPDCPVDTLARLAGIGTQHFFDRFRACTGLTPRGYANVIKFEDALDRVANSSEALADVSRALGFANQSHFTRFFRSRVGLNPRAYRSGAIARRRSGSHLHCVE